MKITSRRLIRGALGGLAWIWLGLGVAQADVIPATDPTTLKLRADATTGLPFPGEATVSLYQLDSTLPVAITSSSASRCVRLGTPFYRDVTDCWLPEVGKNVFVVINGSTVTPALVPPAALPSLPLAAGAPNPFVAALTSSAYPGQCTNTGSGTAPDVAITVDPVTSNPTTFTLQTSATTSVVGYQLQINDCGAMAVLRVGALSYVIPKDGTATVAANGIPEIWENLYGGNLAASGDIDSGPASNAPLGDGISAFDEYRGAMVSGKQVRLNPLQKDVFVYLVTGQCPTSTSPTSLLGSGGYPKPTSPSAALTLVQPAVSGDPGVFTASVGVFSVANVGGAIIGTAGGRATITVVNSPTSAVAEISQPFPGTSIAAGSWQLTESLFANLYGLFSSERLRVLGTAPGSTSNSSEWVDNFSRYNDLTGIVYTAAGSASDRIVNQNRLYGTSQKGVRIIECLDDATTAPYGFAIGGVASPNVIGNVVLYTKRMVNNLTALISNGAPRKVQYSPMRQPALKGTSVTDWLDKSLVGDGDPTKQVVKDFIISKAAQFYTGMEVGHSLDLNVSASNDPHFAAFSGDALDAAITSKPDKSTSGFNTFYIPSVYGSPDQSQMMLR